LWSHSQCMPEHSRLFAIGIVRYWCVVQGVSMSVTTGGCLCGQVRYQISAEPGPSRICWCRDCQRIAANGTANVVFPTDKIAVTGVVSRFIRVADSGNEVTMGFCNQCGTQLFSDSTGRMGLTVVRMGTLDNPSAIRPSSNIWCSSAPTWASIDKSLEIREFGPAPAK
jgi:hypothetical protein